MIEKCGRAIGWLSRLLHSPSFIRQAYVSILDWLINWALPLSTWKGIKWISWSFASTLRFLGLGRDVLEESLLQFSSDLAHFHRGVSLWRDSGKPKQAESGWKCAGVETHTTISRWNFPQWIFLWAQQVASVSVQLGKRSREYSAHESRLEIGFSFSVFLAIGQKVFQVAAEIKIENEKKVRKSGQSVAKVSRNWCESEPKVPEFLWSVEKCEEKSLIDANWNFHFLCEFSTRKKLTKIAAFSASVFQFVETCYAVISTAACDEKRKLSAKVLLLHNRQGKLRDWKVFCNKIAGKFPPVEIDFRGNFWRNSETEFVVVASNNIKVSTDENSDARAHAIIREI